MGTDYMMERALAQRDAGLHDRYRNCVVVSHQMLSRYTSLFPDFTDHTALHTLEILDYCNQLVGEQIGRLSADDLYELLMGAVFHDVGLGVSGRDFEAFLPPGSPCRRPHRSGRSWCAPTTRNFHTATSASIGSCLTSPTSSTPWPSPRCAAATARPTCGTPRPTPCPARWGRRWAACCRRVSICLLSSRPAWGSTPFSPTPSASPWVTPGSKGWPSYLSPARCTSSSRSRRCAR